ncbi:MAG: DUF6506 family protein [Anaerovoracaceae bacterium]|jgi:hypothetical protein
MIFSFMINMEGLDPKKYHTEFKAGDDVLRVYGVDGMQATVELLRQLVADGFDRFNFCSAYTPEMVDELKQSLDKDVVMKPMVYSEQEDKKAAAMPKFTDYGIIIQAVPFTTMQKALIVDKSLKTHIRVVNDLPSAQEAAKDLVKCGVDMIELCSWFKADMTESIIEAIDGRVPVGSAGQ